MARFGTRNRWWMVVIGLLGPLGCGGSAPDSTTVESSAPSAVTRETTEPAPVLPVGDDPAASLARVAERVRAALAAYDGTHATIYPTGHTREAIETLGVTSELVTREGASEVTGIIRVQYQELYSLIHPTVEEARADKHLYPRIPQVALQEMLDDHKNPVPEPWTVEIEYTVRDGQWVRSVWEGKARGMRGAKFLDRLGVP